MVSVDIKVYREGQKWYFKVTPNIATKVAAFFLFDINDVKTKSRLFDSREEVEKKARGYGIWLEAQIGVNVRYEF